MVFADGIRNYLTKFVDDDWMKENKLMEGEPEQPTLEPALEKIKYASLFHFSKQCTFVLKGARWGPPGQPQSQSIPDSPLSPPDAERGKLLRNMTPFSGGLHRALTRGICISSQISCTK